jgi:VanZ family protein
MRGSRRATDGFRRLQPLAVQRSRIGNLNAGVSKFSAWTQSRLGWSCVALVLLLLGVGLWPLRLSAPNNAGWLLHTEGLHFPGGESTSAYDPGGTLFTPEPLALATPGTAPVAGSATFELWLRPAAEPASARGRILALTDRSRREVLYFGQWTTQFLVLRRESDASGRQAFRELDAPDALRTNQARLLTVTTGPSETCLYVDGTAVRRYPNAPLLSREDTLVGKHLYIGNSPDGTCPWAGDYFGMAVYGRQLTDAEVLAQRAWWRTDRRSPPPVAPMALYEFHARSGRWMTNTWGGSNPLFLPPTLSFLKPRLAPFSLSLGDLGDPTLNLFGFVPLGFCVAAWLAGRRPRSRWIPVGLAFLAGAAISLTIELVQVYLPVRDSSVTDLVLNSAGTLVGALAARRLLPRQAPDTKA